MDDEEGSPYSRKAPYIVECFGHFSPEQKYVTIKRQWTHLFEGYSNGGPNLDASFFCQSGEKNM